MESLRTGFLMIQNSMSKSICIILKRRKSERLSIHFKALRLRKATEVVLTETDKYRMDKKLKRTTSKQA